jgi:hypothetical protein
MSAMRMVYRGTLVTALNVSLLAGCGTYVPQIREFYEGPDVTPNLNDGVEFQIKEKIFCELVTALKKVRHDITVSDRPSIPDDFGVQVQINLTVEETGALNPSVTLNDTMRNASVLGVTVPQSFNFGASGTLSSAATRIDTSYSYYIVGRIAGKGANLFCDKQNNVHGSSPFLESNLGIEKYLAGAVQGAAVFRSSEIPKAPKGGGQGGGAANADGGGGSSKKIDIYSYEVKFVIVSNGSANPTWKLVNVSAGTGTLPLVSAGRTRTHDLVLTFGPSTGQGLYSAFQTHFTNQIVSARGRGPF